MNSEVHHSALDTLKSLTWKQWITVVSAVLTVGAGLIYLGSYWTTLGYKKEIIEKDREIAQYQDQLRLIKLKLVVNNNSGIDIKKYIISRTSKDIPEDSIYIDREFFAKKNIPGLTYYKTTVENYNKEIQDEYTVTGILCGEYIKDLADLHVWKGEKVYLFQDNKMLDKIFSSITMQKIMKPRLKNKLIDYFHCLSKEYDSTEIEQERLDRYIELTNNIESLDIGGVLYTLLRLQDMASFFMVPKFIWESSQVEKDEEILIANNLYSFKSPVFTYKNNDKIRYRDLFMRIDIIMVVLDRYIYLITTTSPSAESTYDREFDKLFIEWFTGLRMPEW